MPDSQDPLDARVSNRPIGFFTSVRFVLVGIVVVLGLSQLINSLYQGYGAWGVYKSAIQAEKAESTFQILMKALEALDFERARTVIVLRNAKAISDRDRKFIDQNRNILSQLRADIEQNPNQIFQTQLSQGIAKLCDQLGDVRKDVDINMSKPLSERDSNIVLKWSSATSRLHALIETELLQLMERQLGSENEELLTVSRMQMLRFNGSQLRKVGVGASSRVHMGVRSNKAFSVDALRQISELRGQNEALWMFIEQQSKVINHPQITEDMNQVRELLMERLLPLQDQVLKNAHVGGYDVTEKEYLSVAMPTFKALSVTMETVVEISRALTQQNKQDAISMLAMHGLLVVANLLLIIAAAVFVSVRLVRPLEGMSDLIQLFRKGFYSVGFPWSPRRDEIGRLSEGLEEFRETLIEREQMFKDLEVAKSEAERASRAKSEFLSSMSHELRTPLNAILGFSQLLQHDPRTPLTEAQNEHVSTVITAGEHLLDLINEILDLARIEAGHLQLSSNHASIHELIEGCVGISSTLAEQRGIALTTDCDGIGPDDTIYVDFTRARQILLNLLSNAIKYNRPEGAVHVVCKHIDGDAVKLSVEDTGLGIPEEAQSHMFEVFNRLGAEDTATEGTGIGLVVTKQLVEAMGGEIGFSSVEAEGSTFWVKFPTVSPTDS